jgi:hypothetical protein
MVAMLRSSRQLGVGVLALSLVATVARADDAGTEAPASTRPPPSQPGASVAPASPAPPSPKRPVPSYDGRPPPPTTVGDNLLWVPRVVLFPPYAVNEYVLREPLSVALPAAEKADLFTTLYDVFAFGPDHKSGIFPVALVEFDFKPSVGVYGFWNDAGVKGNDLSAHIEAWPDDWFAATVGDSVALSKSRSLHLSFSEVHRPDQVFYGIGPRSLESSESRFTLQELQGEIAHEWRFWRSSRIETRVGIRDVKTTDGDNYDGDPNLSQEAATGAFATPFGFNRDYVDLYQRVIAAIDTRVPEPRRGSGVRLELDAEQGSDLHNAPAGGWLRYGAVAGAYVDLTGYRRVLGLTVATQFADPLGSEPIPFTELAYLGGDHAMRGFFKRRLIGRSSAVATLNYTWPIGPWVDGDIQFALGNVFDEHLDDLRSGLLRASGAVGVSVGGLQSSGSFGSQDAPIEVLVGIGSETFEQGGQIDSVRVMLGVPHGF